MTRSTVPRIRPVDWPVWPSPPACSCRSRRLTAGAQPEARPADRHGLHAGHGRRHHAHFDLVATRGHIETPDGNSVFMWSYAPTPAAHFQSPGPVLCVDPGPDRGRQPAQQPARGASIVFPGQDGSDRERRQRRAC